MLDSIGSNERVYAEYLEDAKNYLLNEINRIRLNILSERDRALQFNNLFINFDDVSIIVSRSSLDGDTEETLKFGLDENKEKDERGFMLQLTEKEAEQIRTSMDPTLYAALCEEGIYRSIESKSKFSGYAKDLMVLHRLLDFIQTSPNPFDIVEKIKMHHSRV